MVSLILQALRSLMLSKLYCRSQQLKLKRVFLHDEGKPMANHFANDRVWESLGHTLNRPTRFSKFSSAKSSITSLQPRSWKNTQFFEKKRYHWAENNLCLFSNTRATLTSDLFVKAIEFSEQVFDRLRYHFCCIYAVSTSSHHQEEELRFRQGKQLAILLPILRLRGLITL